MAPLTLFLIIGHIFAVKCQVSRRDMRDAYGVYRLDPYDGKKLYVRCNSPTAYISDDCGNNFNTARGRGRGRTSGIFRNNRYRDWSLRDGSSLRGSYRIFGYLKLFPNAGRFYRGRDVISGGRGEVCPFPNYDTHNDNSYYEDNYDDLDRGYYRNDRRYRRRWRRHVDGHEYSDKNGLNQPKLDNSTVARNASGPEALALIRRGSLGGGYEPIYNFRRRCGDSSRINFPGGVLGGDACHWEAELYCDSDYYGDTNYNEMRVRWDRINDPFFPRDIYRNIFDYFGARASLRDQGRTLVIYRVRPADKGTYLCEYESGIVPYDENSEPLVESEDEDAVIYDRQFGRHYGRRYGNRYGRRASRYYGRNSWYGRTGVMTREVHFYPKYPSSCLG